MKSKSILFFLFFLFAFTGCKYDEGPGISFRTACDRVDGEWVIESLHVDDADSLEDFKNSVIYCDYYKFFEGDGEYLSQGHQDNKIYPGNWFLSDNNKYISIGLNVLGQPKPYGPVFNININWKIIRLANDEIWLETTYYNYKKYELRFKAK